MPLPLWPTTASTVRLQRSPRGCTCPARYHPGTRHAQTAAARVLAGAWQGLQLQSAGRRASQPSADPHGWAADFLANFGHTLYDFLFPVFNMLQLLGLYTPDFQLVFARLQVRATPSGQGLWAQGLEHGRARPAAWVPGLGLQAPLPDSAVAWAVCAVRLIQPSA